MPAVQETRVRSLGREDSPGEGNCNSLQYSSLVAQRVKCLPGMQKTRVRSLGREDPLEKEWQPTPVLLPGESHGRRSLVGYNPWGRKESDTTERLHFHFHEGLQDPLELTPKKDALFTIGDWNAKVGSQEIWGKGVEISRD